MFGQRQSRADRVRHEAQSIATRSLARGRHRAEALRDALPEAGDVLAELREQAEPVLRAAREQAEKAPLPQRKRSRSKKPFVFLALLALGAVIAYILFSKRDEDPAYLMHEPDAPDASPVDPPSPGATVNGSTPTDSPAVSSVTSDDEIDVPERVSAYMAGEPAQPSPTTQPSAPAMTSVPRATSDASAFGPSSFSYSPHAQVAAWDLPSSSIPPMRGQTSL